MLERHFIGWKAAAMIHPAEGDASRENHPSVLSKLQRTGFTCGITEVAVDDVYIARR
jgi:hypothetical protein